jgi:hypothetical protein
MEYVVRSRPGIFMVERRGWCGYGGGDERIAP